MGRETVRGAVPHVLTGTSSLPGMCCLLASLNPVHPSGTQWLQVFLSLLQLLWVPAVLRPALICCFVFLCMLCDPGLLLDPWLLPLCNHQCLALAAVASSCYRCLESRTQGMPSFLILRLMPHRMRGPGGFSASHIGKVGDQRMLRLSPP